MVSKTKTLIVVESPAKVKTISKYLGPEYIVRASYGHIIDLVSGSNSGIGVDIENNFKPKYAVMADKKDKLKSICDAASEAKLILLASDPDREGEAIAWHIAGQLDKTNVPIKRVHFKEITKKAVIEGISNPKELDADLYDAQQARRVLDRIVGFLVSPFLINSIKSSDRLSAGRVQSVAVRMVVDREREIENFEPDEYWNVTSCLAKQSSISENFTAKYVNKITDKATADKIKKDLTSDTYIISDVDEKEKKRNPYPPLITSSLAISAAGRYKFAAARTMKAAQALYEAGLITYMRTDSFRISPDAVDACREWLGQNKHDLPISPNSYVSKGGAQDAHEAIRPTDVFKLPASVYLSEDEQKIYRLIWERFVASQMNPALYDTVSVTIKTSSDHVLKSNGRVLKYKGWLDVTGDFENEDEGEAKLPPLKKNDKLVLVPPNVKAEQKFTLPPPRYSEKTLIKELEKRRIGRPSTYAAIMSKITDRGYVIREKSDMFSAGELGKKVIDALAKHFAFMEYKYTAEMEEKLDQVAEGKLDYVGMMEGFYNPFKDQLKNAYSSNDKDYGIKCDVCSKTMKLKHGKFGFFMACSDYPSTCKYTYSCEMVDELPVRKDRIPPVVNGVVCPRCNSGMIKRDGKFGPFYSCSTYPKCNGSGKIPFGKQCSQCSGELFATIFSGETKLACMNYPTCRNIEPIPEGLKVNWIDPSQIKPPKVNSAVKKIINPSRAKK